MIVSWLPGREPPPRPPKPKVAHPETKYPFLATINDEAVTVWPDRIDHDGGRGAIE